MKMTNLAHPAAPAPATTESSSRRILIPLDLEAGSHKALEYAARLVKTEHASICLLHVVDFGPFKSAMADSPMFYSATHIIDRAERHLRMLARHELPPSVPLRIMVRTGKTARETLAAAKEICADLIVLTAPAEAGFLSWLSANPARWIESHAPCSVVVLREPHYGACDCSSKFDSRVPATAAAV